MKSKFLFLVLAVIAVGMMPLTASSQVAADKPAGTEPAEITPKYEVFVGAGYTSLNNVNQSRNGQLGVNVSVTRDWGKYFGIVADGGVYKYPYNSTNPGNPTVDMLFMGPVVHAHLMGPVGVFGHLLLGGEHISGTPVLTDTSAPSQPYATPSTSLAGGYGIGMEYQIKPRIFVSFWGDDIWSAITADLPQSCANMGCSSRTTRSVRSGLGVVYKF